MKRISKYQLEIKSRTDVVLKAGATILSVQAIQYAEPDFGLWLWVAEDPEQPTETRAFSIMRDGYEDDLAVMEYVGMAIMGSIAFQVFEVKPR